MPHGLDTTESTPWQMLPVGRQTRTLILGGVGSREPRVYNPQILNVEQKAVGADRWQLTLISTAQTGRTFVTWPGPKNPSIRWAYEIEVLPSMPEPGFTLEVSVKGQLTLHTTFHYVSDGRLQNTSRKAHDLNDLVNEANSILMPQANILIAVKGEPLPLDISADLGSVVRGDRVIANEPSGREIIAAHADENADFNVFFVKEV